MLKRVACIFALSGIGQAQSSEELRGLMHLVLANVQRADGELAKYAYTRSNVQRIE
jgi:hypothetical protein